MCEKRQFGYSLIELLIVVVILASVAAVAIPTTSADRQRQLDLAAQELAAAMRFARNEAIRTGSPHGFRLNAAPARMRVFSLDMNTIPPDKIFDIYHPITKQLYDFFLEDHPFAADADLSRTTQYSDVCDMPDDVYFDAFGTPRCTDPKDVLLQSYEVTVDDDGSTRVIVVDGITGRVLVQ